MLLINLHVDKLSKRYSPILFMKQSRVTYKYLLLVLLPLRKNYRLWKGYRHIFSMQFSFKYTFFCAGDKLFGLSLPSCLKKIINRLCF